MSATNSNLGLGGGGVSAVATTAVGSVVLPFTSGNTTVSWIALAAIVCGSVIIVSKFAKIVIARLIA